MISSYLEFTDIGKTTVRQEEIDTSNLGDYEAIIKTDYSMISSGTELSRVFALKQGTKFPVRMGYCMVGTVLQKGAKLDLEIGDKVYANGPHQSIIRWSSLPDGTGPQIVKLRPQIFKLPKNIDLIQASSANLMLIAMQGVNLTDTRINDVVGVFGLGNIGLLSALMYKKQGCKVIGFDMTKSRCWLAEQMGINYAVCEEDPKETIDRITEGKGLDVSVDATGVSKVIIDCCSYTKPYGQVLLLGSPRQEYQTDITPMLSNIHMKNLKVIGALNNTVPNHPVAGSNNSVEKNFEAICELIKNKDIDVSKMISRVIDPKDSDQAYHDLMYEKEKVNLIILDWTNY